MRHSTARVLPATFPMQPLKMSFTSRIIQNTPYPMHTTFNIYPSRLPQDRFILKSAIYTPPEYPSPVLRLVRHYPHASHVPRAPAMCAPINRPATKCKIQNTKDNGGVFIFFKTKSIPHITIANAFCVYDPTHTRARKTPPPHADFSSPNISSSPTHTPSPF